MYRVFKIIAVFLLVSLSETFTARKPPRCPKKCICYVPSIICSDVKFSTIGNYLKSNRRKLEAIDITTHIPKLTQKNLMNLRNKFTSYLFITNGGIIDIEKGAFKNISNSAITVDLSNNKIKHISNGMLTGLETAVNLRLDGNRIGYIEVGALSKLKNLETLHLFGNRLTHLQDNVFNGLYNLTLLDVSHNHIRYFELKAFYGLAKLKVLDLNSNPLNISLADVVRYLPKLEMLL